MKKLTSYLLSLAMLFAIPIVLVGCGEIYIPQLPVENHVVRNPWGYYCHIPEEERVTVNVSGQQIDDERLAQMVRSGEIPADVTHLNLRRNKITDISPLAELTQLALFEICGDWELGPHGESVTIQDISQLSALVNLCCLYLGHFYTDNFDALGGLNNLVRLVADNNRYFRNDNGSLSGACVLAIGNLHNLTDLSVRISGWNIVNEYGRDVSQFQLFENLVNLRNLHISTTVISIIFPDFHWLSNQTRLETLSLSGVFKSLEGMQSLSELRDLRLSNRSNTSVSFFHCLEPLANLTNLKSIIIWDNDRITNIAPLGELTNLQYLQISSTKISDIGPVANLTELKSLSVSGEKISCIEPLRNLINLRNLSISQTNVTDLSPLADLPLSRISVWESPINNMGNSGFSFVEFLDLRFNGITDISFLGRLPLPNLRILDITSNNISSLSSLRTRNLPSIERIDFWNNNITEREARAVTNRLNLQEHPGFG